ncbi:Rho GTPase-activating protein 5 [Bulinus truncatus]|nr:Rho GTPase-activating protein 5 [Bulinus truncatus]
MGSGCLSKNRISPGVGLILQEHRTVFLQLTRAHLGITGTEGAAAKEINSWSCELIRAEDGTNRAIGEMRPSEHRVNGEVPLPISVSEAQAVAGTQQNFQPGFASEALQKDGVGVIAEPEVGTEHKDNVSSGRDEEKRAKEGQKKFKKKEKPSAASTSWVSLEDFPTALENPFIPQFVYKCVSYIEAEGMKTEGLYRIPGNKAQGELFVTKFALDPNVDISTLEIPVNAIATLLKSFFSDLSEALIPEKLCDELMEAAEMTDKSSRLLMLRGVIKKLPPQNFEVLKYIISHLFKVSQNHEFNSMNSRNLAKCWWPTLIRLQFKSYEKLIQGSQVPEDIVQNLIEQCAFFFHGGNEV